MDTVKTATVLGVIAVMIGACASRNEIATVPFVDLERYAGKWYEIARFPNSFQKSCARDVTAEYTLQSDGSVRVVNRCVRSDGTTREAIGEARAVEGSGNARLRVSFGIPFIRGDYWILALDPDYRWALVGGPTHKYLWILARGPVLPGSELEKIRRAALSRGYDPDKLVFTQQTGS